MRRGTILLFLFLLACDGKDTKNSYDTPRLVPSSYKALIGWEKDDLQTFFVAFQNSCKRIKSQDPERPFGNLKEMGKFRDWQRICMEVEKIKKSDTVTLHKFLEQNFLPMEVQVGAETEGLFTGYYEASLHGSMNKDENYKYPLYSRPEDLVMVELGSFREELKGQRIAGRVEEGNLLPYETREEIVAGAWPHNDKVLVWVNNAVDAFFVQIQGSGVVELPDGSNIRIGYAGQNGYPYYAIGRELVKRGYLTKESVSMQSIKAWLTEHSEQADEIMNTNKSYVFFRKIENSGPIGGEGVALTPYRSLAIDHSLFPYGVPIWLEAEASGNGDSPIQRLMISQDTGGAIRGGIRGDVFWGYGNEAEAQAGAMKSNGRYWFLVPQQK